MNQRTNLFDGVKNFLSSLVASRDVTVGNHIQSRRLSNSELTHIYRHGIANKIVRLKAGMALKDTLQFESEEDRTLYENKLEKHIKAATKWMLAFGRGILVIQHPNDNLNEELGKVDLNTAQFHVFSGDMVTALGYVTDLMNPRYFKPDRYMVRGYPIHPSRVVDFTYIEPPELEKPFYQYGGISEFEMIYEQLIADGIVQRSSPRIIEKASTLFYKVTGFKEAMRSGQENDMVAYFSRLEDVRGINAAGIVDTEDEIEAIQQTISNLSEADQITLRRLAMVTGISITRLVGENVKGLNSSGDNEAQMDQDMIETLQSDYLLEPINDLMAKLRKGRAWFRDNQGETPKDRVEYETKAIENAIKLFEMGEDYKKYLEDKDVIQKDDFAKMFSDEGLDDETQTQS